MQKSKPSPFPFGLRGSRCLHLTASIRSAAVSRCGSLTWSQTSDVVCQEVSSVVTWWRPRHKAESVSLHRPWKELSCFTRPDNYFPLILPCQAQSHPSVESTSRYPHQAPPPPPFPLFLARAVLSLFYCYTLLLLFGFLVVELN